MSRARKVVRVGSNWKMVAIFGEVKRFDDIKGGDYFWNGYELHQRVVNDDRPEVRLSVRIEDGDLQTYDFSPYVHTVTLELRRIQEARHEKKQKTGLHRVQVGAVPGTNNTASS